MQNLWKETIRVLKLYKKNWKDVSCIVCNNFKITKDNFERLATRTDYDDGFGAPKIASDLKVVGEDWWLERTEYDGAENWVFKQMPLKYLPLREVDSLCCGYNNTEIGWCTLAELNGIEEVE